MFSHLLPRTLIKTVFLCFKACCFKVLNRLSELLLSVFSIFATLKTLNNLLWAKPYVDSCCFIKICLFFNFRQEFRWLLTWIACIPNLSYNRLSIWKCSSTFGPRSFLQFGEWVFIWWVVRLLVVCGCAVFCELFIVHFSWRPATYRKSKVPAAFDLLISLFEICSNLILVIRVSNDL